MVCWFGRGSPTSLCYAADVRLVPGATRFGPICERPRDSGMKIQLFPFYDDTAIDTLGRFETAVYQSI